MNAAQQGVITLLKSSITGEKLELPEGFSLGSEEVKTIIKRHHVMTLVYEGALNCGIPMDDPMMKALFRSYCRLLIGSEGQMAEAQKVFDVFEAYGIDYLPTKGCNMKAMYPKPELRLMGDADISIRVDQRGKIKEALESIGFVMEMDTADADVWNGEKLHLELHKHMRSFYNEAYYDDVFERAKCVKGHRYVFSTEDAFIHIFNHMARHYRGGGIGLRHMVDLYVYRRNFPQMDEAYICQEMRVLKLEAFYKNVCRMLDAWFYDGELDEVTEFLSQMIFSNGSWGSRGSHALASEVTRANASGIVSNTRVKNIIRTLFPPVSHMRIHYPILDKVPFLLPVTWVMRGFTVILFRRKNFKIKMVEWKAVDDANVRNSQNHFKFVGLDVDDE